MRLFGGKGHGLNRAQMNKYQEGKQKAMQIQASEFYSRYPEQSWKNLLSIGDSVYEFNAMNRLGSKHRAMGGKEVHLRSKMVRLLYEPSFTSLTLQLRLFTELLPTLMRFNGCLKLNLPESRDPLRMIAQDLGLPRLVEFHPLRSIWDPHNDAVSVESSANFDESLLKVRGIVEDSASSILASSPRLRDASSYQSSCVTASSS